MNETECEDLIKSVKWTEPSSLISLAILEFINVLVIGGNLLVIAAVFCSNKLRSVTNFFIVNLAVADLLVGLAVLPFSATWEVYKVWIFGDVWCRIWLAVDVWMCTASILNLCAISLDRYVAVTRPVTYPSIMSTKKAKSLIAGIWVLSFVICFPPLVGWKDQKPIIQPLTYTKGNYTLYYASPSTTTSAEEVLEVTMSVAPPLAPMGLHRQRRHLRAAMSLLPSRTSVESSYSKSRLRNGNAPLTWPSSLSSSSSSSSSLPWSPASSSSKSSPSSVYNSFNPYDPYNAHLEQRLSWRRRVNKRHDNANDQVAEDEEADAPPQMNESDDEEANTSSLRPQYEDFDGESSMSAEDTGAGFNNADYETYSRESVETSSSASAALPSITTANAATTIPPDSAAAMQPPASLGNGVPPPCPWKCELTNDRGYVLYSALGSFYIPMFVMLFFYWRIYRAAVRTTRAINQGFKTTKGTSHESGPNRVDESQLVLRIHRGRPCSTPQRTPLSVHSMSSTLSVNSNNEEMLPLHQQPQMAQTMPKRATSMRVPSKRHEKIAIKVSFPSSENMLDSSTSINSTPPAYASVVSSTNVGASKSSSLTNGRQTSFKSKLFEIGETTFNVDTKPVETGAAQTSPTQGAISAESHPNRDSIIKKSDSSKKHRGKRSVKFQVKRFKVETKAAKTLAIIVGGFIFCWLPFFTMYLIRAFCDHCIQPTVFSVLFWLGYCNSAINPLIYALFSHEFRIAFKRIVCRCVCTRSGFRASENFQMIAARALMAPATFHKTISGCSDEGDGPDFS